MEVVISNIRWPAILYREIKKAAKEQNLSVNALVVSTMETVFDVKKTTAK